MRYLIFMDFVSQNWREAGFWIGLALLAWFAIYLIRAPHMAKSAKKIAARAAGALLLVVLGLSSCTFMLGKMLGSAPRERAAFTSGSGNRVALVSHSSYRDFTTTQVAVKGDGCCSRYIAYDYEGDGDDFMEAKPITWIDDHKMVIRYSTDTTGTQVCRAQVGDIQVICEARPAPTFENGRCTANCWHPTQQ
jgi:hypothetical protein